MSQFLKEWRPSVGLSVKKQSQPSANLQYNNWQDAANLGSSSPVIFYWEEH